ncbi:MAG: helix-turn-helix domain-containing protein [Leptospira sp.]|nr:helix-turn-helix domain-containing protein [Leptospira sp.]
MRFTEKFLEKEYQKFANPSSEKERDILRAAEKVFGEKGFDLTTTKELAQKAGVTERTLFRYFASKNELYLRILSGIVYDFAFQTQMIQLKTMLEAREAKFSDWFLYIFHDRVKVAKENPHKIRILVSALLQNKEFGTFFGKVWKEKLYLPAIMAVEHFQKIGEIRNDIDVPNYVRTSFGIHLSYLIFRFVLAPHSMLDDELEAKKILNIVTSGILCKDTN